MAVIKRYAHNGRDPLTGRKLAEKRSTEKHINIIRDIDPYRSVITDEVIGSRSTHRDHLRQHGCEEVGNEMPKPKAKVEIGDARADVAQVMREKGMIG